jgi:signal transduction histidine kinase
VRQGGRVIGLEGFIIDTTWQKRAEDERKSLEARLWQARKSESLARMAGAVAHHFNNQLAVILGNLELALEDLPGDAAVRPLLLEAMGGARHSSEISGFMLTYLGRSGELPGPVDLSRLCRESLPRLRKAMGRRCVLETRLAEPGPVVLAAPDALRLVLVHLVTNASEAVGDQEGKVLLTVKVMGEGEMPAADTVPLEWQPGTGGYACIEVSDTGCGIPGEDLPQLFDPFFTTKFTGRGLGLPLVLGTVRSWNGAVHVECSPGEGSRFRVLLPLASGGEAAGPAGKGTEDQEKRSG